MVAPRPGSRPCKPASVLPTPAIATSNWSPPVPLRRTTGNCGGQQCVARITLCNSTYDTVMSVFTYDPVHGDVLQTTSCYDDMPDINRSNDTSSICPNNPYASQVYVYVQASTV